MLQCSSRGFIASARLYEDINSPEVFLLEYCEVSSGICSYQSHTLPFLISGPFSPSGFEESLGFAWTWILWWWVENYLYINRHAYWTNKAIYCLTGPDTGTRWWLRLWHALFFGKLCSILSGMRGRDGTFQQPRKSDTEPPTFLPAHQSSSEMLSDFLGQHSRTF